MPQWIRVARAEELPPGRGLEVVAEGRIVALFHVREGDQSAYYALDGICSHQGGPIAKGELSGCVVACPWHGWRYDVRTGQQQVTRTIFQPRFPVKVEDGEVYIDLETPPASGPATP